MLPARTLTKNAWFAGVICFLFCAAFVLLPSPAHANSNHKGSTPFERMAAGQYIIKANINGQGPFKFMIDTAATRTSIFEKTRKRLGITLLPDKEAFISGMIEAGYRPTARIANLAFAGLDFSNHKVIILKDWDDPEDPIDGILGIEVFNNLVLHFSHANNQLKIRSRTAYNKQKYRNWDKITLQSNPYAGEDYGLLFTYTQIGELFIPTMIDTGANFSTIDWKSVRSRAIEQEKRRLRKEWVIQGAIGEFKPRMLVRLDKVFIGGVSFNQHDFLVMDFDKLPINKYGKYPLVITGVDLMAGRDFVLDFKNRKLLIAPSSSKLNLQARASRIERPSSKY